MSPWLLVQVLYATAAWYLAARAVLRAAHFAGETGDDLAATVRELRRTGRSAEVTDLGRALDPSPIGQLLEDEGDLESAEALVADADRALALGAPPVRMLRGLATVGTTLGLLAAVASLRAGLGQSAGAPLERAAAGALDSAVFGFVTALPCWTAVGLCRRWSRTAAVGLERVLVALRSEPEPLPGTAASLGEHASEAKGEGARGVQDARDDGTVDGVDAPGSGQ